MRAKSNNKSLPKPIMKTLKKSRHINKRYWKKKQRIQFKKRISLLDFIKKEYTRKYERNFKRKTRRERRFIIKKILFKKSQRKEFIKNITERNKKKSSFLATNSKNKLKTKISRISKLINFLMKKGNKIKIKKIITNVIVRLTESFSYSSGKLIFESVLERLEPLVDFKEKYQRKRKAGRNLKKKNENIVVIPCNFKKRKKLAFLFFIKGVRLRQKREQISFEESIFYEIMASVTCVADSYCFEIKGEHVYKTLSNRKSLLNRKIRIAK